MTIDILIEALTMLRDRGDNPDYKREVIENSLGELYGMKRQSVLDLDHWNGSVHVMHTADILTMGNHLMYDEFGKMMRSHCGDLPFPVFLEKVNGWFEMALSYQAAHAIYDYLRDLWTDNERYGQNAEDGTFKR